MTTRTVSTLLFAVLLASPLAFADSDKDKGGIPTTHNEATVAQLQAEMVDEHAAVHVCLRATPAARDRRAAGARHGD